MVAVRALILRRWKEYNFGLSVPYGMELRHLRYFVTAAEELNISRASSRLRISQPAVSRQIHDLEDELGVELFVRESGGLRLTPAGEAFLPQARDILRRSREAVDRLQAFRNPAPGENRRRLHRPDALRGGDARPACLRRDASRCDRRPHRALTRRQNSRPARGEDRHRPRRPALP